MLAALAVVALAALPGVELPDPPAPVGVWFEQEGPGVVQTSENSGLPPEQLVSVEVGVPTAVGTWSEEFLAGRSGADPVVPSGEWIAPITVEGAGSGALVAAADGPEVLDHRVIWDEDLGEALLSPQDADPVLEAEISGWFRLAGDDLSPVTAEARDVLAGTIAVADYQPFLVERRGVEENPAPLPEAQDNTQLRPVLVTAGIVLGVLAVVGTIVWIRRPEVS